VAVETKDFSNTYRLHVVSGISGHRTLIASNSTSFEPGFTMDDTHLYWTQGSGVNGTVHRLRRVAKTGGTPADYIPSSTTAQFLSPLSDASNLWWQQKDLTNGTYRLRRRNHVSGNYSSINFPLPGTPKMLLRPDDIYLMGVVSTNPNRDGYGRTNR
jgi:hypothetical protein